MKRAVSGAPRFPAIPFVILALAGALGTALTQPRLAAAMHGVKEREDVYALPPPAQLRALTLGYHAAAVDLLWAKLLVQYGTHWQEKRPFSELPRYLDAILELEPDYAPLYKFVDTLLVFRPPRGTEEDARLARRYLERGLRERPHDYQVWFHYGQFIAFLGPSFLTSDAEKERWRRDGAEALIRAVDLGARPDSAVSAATILSRTGERTAAVEHLRSAYALADDAATRAEIGEKLQRLEATAEREAAERDARFIESRWRRDYPFLSRGEYLVIGPVTDPLECAGLGRAGDPDCARAWGPSLPSARP